MIFSDNSRIPRDIAQTTTPFLSYSEVDPNILAIIVPNQEYNQHQHKEPLKLIVVAKDELALSKDLDFFKTYDMYHTRSFSYRYSTIIDVPYNNGVSISFHLVNEDWLVAPLRDSTDQLLDNGFHIIFDRIDLRSKWKNKIRKSNQAEKNNISINS